MKCNPGAEVLATVLEEGASFEVASIYELDLVRHAGADPRDVLYSNPVKPSAHIAAAARAGTRRFAMDSECEVRKLASAAPGSEVYVRLAVEDRDSLFPLSGKFGVGVDEAERLLLLSADLGLRPYGLTFHVGSQCTDAAAWGRAIAASGEVLRRLDRHGIRLSLLDLGGGFPVRYADEVPSLDAIAAGVHAGIAALPYRPERLVAEPGRFLVADAAVMVASVIGLTRRDGRQWVHLDVGGYNGLMETVQTGGRWLFPLWTTARSDRLEPGVLTGPSCDSSDTMFYDVGVPDDLRLDDRVVIGCAGAYTLSYASSFNGSAPPSTVVRNEPLPPSQ